MFDFQNFDTNKFQPNSPFEGWIFAKIQNIEKTLSNHLSHHIKMELCGLTAILALVASLIYIILAK